jgi:hypothetical protein
MRRSENSRVLRCCLSSASYENAFERTIVVGGNQKPTHPDLVSGPTSHDFLGGQKVCSESNSIMSNRGTGAGSVGVELDTGRCHYCGSFVFPPQTSRAPSIKALLMLC